MTPEEAIKVLEDYLGPDDEYRYESREVQEMCEAVEVALTSLRHQIWEDQLWHDAKTDPPKTPGLYYGKTDDTNSMYACQYRDGVWVLDMYPQQMMEIVQWADYTAFVQDNVESAPRPVSREQVEKAWRGEWIGMTDNDGCTWQECSRCEHDLDSMEEAQNFCPACGAPMTDEAVEMVMERWEELNDGKGD